MPQGALTQVALFLTCFAPLARSNTQIPVAGFQLDGKATKATYLKVSDEETLDLTHDFTVSFWLKLNFLNTRAQSFTSLLCGQPRNHVNTAGLFMFMEIQEEDVQLSISVDHGEHNINCHFSIRKGLRMLKWHHFSLTFERNGDMGTVTGAFDNKLSCTASTDNIKIPSLPLTPIAIFFGQYITSLDGGDQYDVGQSFSGELADFTFWNRSLSKAEIGALASCQSQAQDFSEDLLVWGINGSDFMASNITWKHIESSEFCQEDILRNKFLWLWETNFDSFSSYCHLFGGKLPVVLNQTENLQMYHTLQTILNHNADPGVPDKVAYGVTNIMGLRPCQNGQGVCSIYNNAPADLAISALKNYSDTTIVASYFGELFTMGQGFSFVKGFCFLEKEALFTLRGLYQRPTIIGESLDVIDNTYYIHGTINGLPYFRGVKRSEILFDFDEDTWILRNTNTGKAFKLMDTKNALPIGRQTWAPLKPSNSSLGEFKLSLTICKNHEFTCDSGQCIPLQDRCNNLLDCHDMTDEVDCTYIQRDSTYNKNLNPTEIDGPLLVYIEFFIRDLPTIDTFSMRFTSKFMIAFYWYDNRLVFTNLQSNPTLNTLSKADREYIWVPKLTFSNTLDATETQFDEKSLVNIRREKNPVLQELGDAKEGYVSSGQHCRISTSRSYFNEFTCQFGLISYPFDTQVCTIEMEYIGGSSDFLKLVKSSMNTGPKGVALLSDPEKMEYNIKYFTSNTITLPSYNNSGYQVFIVFQRRMEYHVLNTFFQTFLLTFIGFLTCFFDVNNFTDRIMVTLTTMLVVATITSSIQEGLPKTSFYKMIDYWLLFCLSLLIFIMIIHTVIARKLQEPESNSDEPCKVAPVKPTYGKKKPTKLQQAKRLNRIGRVMIIVVCACFYAGFWSLSLKEYYKPLNDHLEEFKKSKRS